MRVFLLLGALAAFMPLAGCIQTESYKELITELDGNGKIVKQIYTEHVRQQDSQGTLTFKYLKKNG